MGDHKEQEEAEHNDFYYFSSAFSWIARKCNWIFQKINPSIHPPWLECSTKVTQIEQ